MNTQVIKIIDDMIHEQKSYIDDYTGDEGNHEYELEFRERKLDTLIEVKDKISSLPSLDIDSLQRYKLYHVKGDLYKDDNGDYIRYDDLLKLLKND